MRLRVKENLRRGQSMRTVALEIFKDEDTSDITKVSRLSALNTGRKIATIKELHLISKATKSSYRELMPAD